MAARFAASRGSEVASCSTSRSARPFTAKPYSSSRRMAPVRAAADNSSIPAVRPPPVLTWPQDNESAREVFAFSGSLPERLNGRLAMIGFAGIALAELQQGVGAGEQFAGDAVGVTLLSLALTFASIFPKFVSGTSLKELHNSATSDNLKGTGGLAQVLGLFDQNLELWTGRIAMLGVSGLVAVEAVTGKVFF